MDVALTPVKANAPANVTPVPLFQTRVTTPHDHFHSLLLVGWTDGPLVSVASPDIVYAKCLLSKVLAESIRVKVKL